MMSPMKYPIITRMLKDMFNSEDGLSEDTSIGLYIRSASSEGIIELLKLELEAAFSNENLDWRSILANDDYEVYWAETEEEARQYSKRILWTPIFGADLQSKIHP